VAAALAAPFASAVPGAESLRISSVFRNAFRRGHRRTSVFPPLQGVGPTFDARGS
jgi:hypothetical protein